MKKPRALTRRDFMKTLAVAGGTTAMWAGLKSWGLAAPTRQDPPPLEGDVEDVSVIILGAGIGGMVSAYELRKLGYNVTILEARDYAGGHCWTARQGATINEYGMEERVCDFDEGLWANLGPWRIPHHHKGILHYTRALNVPLQIFVNYQFGNYSYVEGDFGPLSGQRIREREWRANMAGYTGELLAKAASEGRLDDNLSNEHVDMLVDYLVNHDLLDADTLEWTGSGRAGYTTPPGAGFQDGTPKQPIPFDALLPWAAEIQRAQGYYLGAVAGFSQQETMLQPVGGMDQIAQAFARELGDIIQLRQEVQEIRQSEDGVRIVYQNLDTGETGEMSGDYCLCNIPLTVLANIPADFTSERQEAIRSVEYAQTGKIGLQFRRRFWEEDDNIYGGSTRTNIPEVGDLHYYAYNFQGEKGTIQGYYNFGTDAIKISRLSEEERIEFALSVGEKIHPQYREEFETGFSVAWHRVPYSLGGWPSYSERSRELYYPTLVEPDGRIYLVGEHLSHVTGWMEGAVLGAWLQLDKLHKRVTEMGG